MNKYIRVILILQLSVLATRGSAIAQDWKKVNSPYGHIRAVITTSNRTIIVGIGKGFIYGSGKGTIVSTDGGKHWTPSNNDLAKRDVLSFAKTGNIILAGTDCGIYRSSDDGRTWDKTSLPDSTYHVLIMAPNETVYAKAENGDLYRINNFGNNWKALNVGASIGDLEKFQRTDDILINDRGNLFFRFDSCSFVRSIDLGATWKRTIVSSIKTHDWLRIAVRGNNIIVGKSKGGLFKSTDDGTSWNKMKIPEGSVSSIDYMLNGNLNMRMYEPDGKYVSSDDGNTWQSISTIFDNISADRYCGDTLLAIASVSWGSTLIRSVDSGKSWHSLISSFYDVEVMGVSPAGELYVGTEWCGGYKSRDYGATWEPFIDVSCIEKIVFVSENCVALSTSISGVFTAERGGKNWNSAASYGLNDFRIHSLISTKQGTLLAGGTSEIVMLPAKDGRGSILTHKGGGLWRSTNQGVSWNRIIFDNSYSTKDNGKTWVKYDSVWKRTTIDTLQPDFSINSMGIDPEGRICMNANCDYKTGIYISTNEGESWNKLKDIDRYDKVHTSFIKTTCGEVFSGISRSTDNGKTFKDVVSGLSTPEPNNLQPLPNGDMLVSTGNGLFYLPQGGTTWYCVGFKNNQVKYTTVTGEYVFVSVNFGYEDERNGMYRTNLREIQALIPKKIVESEMWQEIGKPLDGKPRLFSIDKSGTIWLANDNGKLARSTDQGMNWTTSKLPDEFIQSLITDTVGKTIFLGSYDGFFQSKNNGETWEKILYMKQNDELRDPYVHNVFLDNDGALFLGVSQRGPFRSPCADTSKKVMSYISFGGSSYGRVYSQKPHANKWIQSDSILPNEPDQILRNKKGILYAAVRGEGIYSSTDDGISWLGCNNGLLPKDGFYMCNIGAEIDRSVNCMTMDTKGTLYVIRASSQLYRLKSDCQSWEYVNALGGRGSSLIIDSHNILYIGTAAGVFRSEDNGKNWESYSVGLTSSSIMELVAHPNGYLFAATEDGRIYKSIQRVESNQK
ncbi:MAG: YCF48-related protein [Bacteroidota bacterium]